MIYVGEANNIVMLDITEPSNKQYLEVFYYHDQTANYH